MTDKEALVRSFWDGAGGEEAWRVLSRLAATRKTPFLAINRKLLRRRAQEFLEFAPKLRVFYAVKANHTPALVKYLASLGLGFELSSERELDLVLAQGVPAERLASGNPVKSQAFIEKTYRIGMREFVMDSPAEVDKLARWAPGSAVLVRLTVDNKGAEWPLDRKFGVDSPQALELLRYARQAGLRPAGVAFHVGSQSTHHSSWEEALRQASRLWHQAREEGMNLTILNIGGGFPARYLQPVPSVSAILNTILQAVQELFPPEIALWAEPGRAVVAEAGIMVASVIGKGSHGGVDYLFLDLGVFNGLAEALGGIRYSLAAAGLGEKKRWLVVGPTCDSMDICQEAWLAEPEVGEKLLLAPAGAYTTAYASSFNGARVPAVYLI